MSSVNSHTEAAVTSLIKTLQPAKPEIIATPALEGVPEKKGRRCRSGTVTAENSPELARAETRQIPETHGVQTWTWMDMITRSKFLLRLDLGQPQDPGKDRVLVRVERRVCWFTEQPEDRCQTLLLPTCGRGHESRTAVRAWGCPPLGSGLTPALGCRGASSGVPGPVRLLPPDMCWAAPVGSLPLHAPWANLGARRQNASRQHNRSPESI